MRIDTVVFFQITDPKLFTYGVENPIMAIENLTATTLRNIIGDLELDQTLTSRETINAKMRASLDIATHTPPASVPVLGQSVRHSFCHSAEGSLLYAPAGICRSRPPSTFLQ